MSAAVASQFTAAAGAFLFGLLALMPSLLVRSENRGLDGFVADLTGVAGTGGLYLLAAHLFASGAVTFYSAATFVAGLVVARSAFRRVRPRLAAMLAPLTAFLSQKKKLAEEAKEKSRLRGAERVNGKKSSDEGVNAGASRD